MSNNSNIGYESNLLFGSQSMYGIYQLKDNEITREFAFEGTAFLERKGIEISKDNYELIYVAPTEYNAKLSKNEILEEIYNKFNYARPEDFKGHSLSVSDVVVMNNDGVVSSHFVDRFGFKDVSNFTNDISKYYDPEYDRFVTEDVIKNQYEWFESQPWFEKSYEQFKAENFTEIANTELSYYVIADIFTWKNTSSDRSELTRFEDLAEAMAAFSSLKSEAKNDDEEFHTTLGMKVNGVEFDLVYTKGNDTVLSLDFSHNEDVAKNKDFQEILKNICVDLEIGKVRIHREMSPEEVKNFTKQRFKTHLENTNCDEIDSYMNNFDRIYGKGNILDRYMPSISQRNIVEDVSFVDWNMDNPYFELDEPREMAFSVDGSKFISIQRCDGGYDYSVYDKDYQLLDGGVYDNPDISIHSALHSVCAEYLQGSKSLNEVDYEELLEKVEEVEQAKVRDLHTLSDYKVKTDEKFNNKPKRKGR